MKKALICGISGQDGAYLAQLLINKGYTVIGTSRDAQISSFRNLLNLGIKDQVKLESMALNDFRSVLQVLTKIQPDEIYNLAGQSSVGLSFEQPVETLESIATGTLNLLEAIRFLGVPIKLIMLVRVNVLGILVKSPLMKQHHFDPEALMLSLKPLLFGKLLTTEKLMVCLPVLGFCLIMNLLYVLKDL